MYLIGRPQSGKTTAFSALCGDGGGYQRVAKVPDPRLDRLVEIFRPAKVVPAEILFRDIFAQRAAELTGRAADRFTTALSDADVLAIVIRCFGDVDADGAPLDPVGALDEVMLELVVADHGMVERRLERIAQDLKKGLKELLPERAVLERCLAQLSAEQPLVGLELSAAEEKLLRGFRFLSQKPAVVIANIAEGDLAAGAPEDLVAAAAARGLPTVAFCAELEAEIAALDAPDQADFLADYGIAEAAAPRLVRACVHALDLICFFTGSEKEVRAWPIRRGLTAAQAAGTIHSDFERGFIRAETVAFDVLAREGSLHRCRERGLLRLEGRDYVVHDGDFITFRFNV